MLLKLLEHDLDSALELRIVAGGNGLRIILDLDVRSDAVILDLKLTVQAVESSARRSDGAAVEGENRLLEGVLESMTVMRSPWATNTRCMAGSVVM